MTWAKKTPSEGVGKTTIIILFIKWPSIGRHIVLARRISSGLFSRHFFGDGLWCLGIFFCYLIIRFSVRSLLRSSSGGGSLCGNFRICTIISSHIYLMACYGPLFGFLVRLDFRLVLSGAAGNDFSLFVSTVEGLCMSTMLH